MSPPSAPTVRPWRWRLRLLGALALVSVVVLAALPHLLGTGPARRWLLRQANASLSPGGTVDVEALRLSWFAPTRLTGLVISDAHGRPTLSASGAIWDRTLGRILLDRHDRGTLTLIGARLDVERRPDGSVNLYEALRPILVPDPRTHLTLRIPSASLRLRSPELAQPVVARSLELMIHRPPAPHPLSWRADLVAEPGTPDAPKLSVVGELDLWKSPSDLVLTLGGSDWPLDLSVDGIDARVRYDGRLRLSRHSGLWSTSGDACLIGVEARRPGSGAAPLVLEHIGGTWDATQTPAGWVVQALDLSGPIGHLKGQTGLSPGPMPTILAQIEGDLDLAALAALMPGVLPEGGRLDGGHAHLSLTTRADRSTVEALSAHVVPIAFRADPSPAPVSAVHLEGRVDVDGLIWSDPSGTLEAPPLSLSVRASYRPDGTIDLEDLVLDGPPGTIQASGRIDDRTDPPHADLEGTIDFDWDILREHLAEAIEPAVRIEGEPARFRLAGPLDGGPDFADIWRDLDAGLDIDLMSASAFGLNAGPATISLRSLRGEVEIEPIRTTLNGGTVELHPELLVDEGGLLTLRLDPRSSIEDAEINDEASRRILSYVVPLMAQATRVNGRVSASFDRAEFPIDLGEVGPDPARHSVVEGQLLFREVAFSPGPLAAELIDLVGIAPDQTLRLDQPVTLAIADGVVHQSGLAVPLGPHVRIELEGTVGFDRSLDLITRIPVTDEMFGRAELIGRIADGLSLSVPIAGTLDHPKLDRESFRRELAATGKDLLRRTAVHGGVGLLIRAITPRDPDAVARRKAEREQKREERLRAREARRQGQDNP